MQPVLFISHGAPTFTLEPNRTTAAWQSLAASLIERPRVVLWVSAHWDGDRLRLAGGVPVPRIQYDFYGFPEPFYRLGWPTPSRSGPARRGMTTRSPPRAAGPALPPRRRRPLEGERRRRFGGGQCPPAPR